MSQSCSTSGFATQADKIENLLRSRYGQWIPAYELADVALQYCARINSIPPKSYAMPATASASKTRRGGRNGQVHGSYRIVRTTDALGLGPSKPVKSLEQVCLE